MMKRRALATAATLLATVPVQAAITNAPEAPATNVKVETFAQGLENPWGLEVLPDGRLLVTERPGRMRVVATDGGLSAPVANVPAVVAKGQGGLLDVALAPDFATTSTIYFSFSEDRGWLKNATAVARAKLVLEGETPRLEDVKIIFQQEPAARSFHHFGSRIEFARDGTLFIATGDRFSLRDEAQNPANHLGKVIRITADGAPAPDNPKLPGWDAKVWSIGHRNMQGAAIDPATGLLWTIEHGARGGDELNQPQAGKNYGWPIITWGIDYSGEKIGEGTAKEGLEQPVYYWNPSIAVSGLAFYTGTLFPDWNGNILVGALAGSHLERLVMKDGVVVAHEQLLSDFGERIRDVKAGPDGAVWLLTDSASGRVLRLTPAS